MSTSQEQEEVSVSALPDSGDSGTSGACEAITATSGGSYVEYACKVGQLEHLHTSHG